MARTVHVFTGPTLSAGDVHRIIPDAQVRPPVQATDLLHLDARPGDVVVIIDGYFQQAQAVRHKEILLLIERGVEVWGAASMGALRAAELHRMGMRGAGAVFHLYARGIIEGDDEVGVTHGRAEHGYPIVADALVNIRCTVRRAVRDGLVTTHDAQQFVAAAQQTPFEQRTPLQLVEAAVEQGLDSTTAERIAALLTTNRVDVKRTDALLALRRVQRRHRHATQQITVSDHAHLHLWRQRTATSSNATTTDLQALTAARLYAEDWVSFAAPVALRTLAAMVTPPPPSPQTDEQLLRRIAPQEERDDVLLAHDLHRDELLRHLRREERLAATLGSNCDDDAAIAGLVLAAAGRRGLFAPRDADRWQPRWLRRCEHGAPDAPLIAARRALAVAPGLSVHEPFTVALKLRGRFRAARSIAAAALDFNGEVRGAHPDFDVARLDAARVTAWFAERWATQAEEIDQELLDRGFADREEFLAAARPFYMADKFRPAHRGFTIEPTYTTPSRGS